MRAQMRMRLMNENDLTAAIAVNNMLCDTTIACFTAA